MQKLAVWTLGLIGLVGSSNPRSVPTGELTLKVESMTARPATFSVWTVKRRLVPPVDTAPPVVDSVTATTPASIPIDSATGEIHILVRANAPVRVQVLDGSRELQRPTNAWGRDLKLRRQLNGHFDVVFDMRPIHPRP